MLDTTEHSLLADLVLKRFGNIDSAHLAWKRLMQNNCTQAQFLKLTSMNNEKIEYELFLAQVDEQLHELKKELEDDKDLLEPESAWFEQLEPPCGAIKVREFLDSKYLNYHDCTIFNDTLLKSPTTDLLWASKVASIDAYREFIQDRFKQLFSNKNK